MDVEDALAARARPPAGLLHQEAHGGGLVLEPELAAGPAVGAHHGRIEEDAALQQRAMDVGDHGAHVARGVGTARGLVVRSQVLDVAPDPRLPHGGVALVHAVDPAPARDADVLVRVDELPDGRLQGEAVHALARGVHQHGAGAVHDVARRHLGGARLHGVRRHRLAPRAAAAPDGEDGADDAVDVQVRGAVHGIDAHHVGALAEIERLVQLLGHDDAYQAARVERADDHVVGPQVELLHHLALDVDATGVPEAPHERGLRQLARDELARHRQLVQHDGEIAAAERRRADVLG